MADGAEAGPRPGAPAGRRGRDLTSGPIMRTLILFALPTLGSNILQSLNGSINTIWIGRFLGEQALAAGSNANLILFLAISAVFGFGMAATIIVGQAMGRRDVDAARRAIGTAIGAFGMASVAVAAIGWFSSVWILHLLATPPEVLPYADAYLRVIFLCIPGVFLSTLLVMGMRGTGDSLTPLWFMVLSVVLDSGLNPVFILGLGPAPKMGIAGSATATLIANYVTLAALVVTIYRRDMPLRLRGAELRYLIPERALLRLVVVKGLPMGLQMVMISLAGIAMIGLVNRHGTVVTAAYGVALQLWTYVQMPAMAIGAAVSAMAAQNIGAGRWDRIGRVTRAGLIINVLMTGATVVLLLAFDRAAMALFLGSASPAIPIARHIQVIGTWGFVMFGASMVFFATMRANGAVVGPLVVLTVAVLPVRLGFSVLLEPTMGQDALWWSVPLGSAAALVGSFLFYIHGGWRKGGLAVEAPEAEERSLADCDTGGRMAPVG